MKNALDFFIGVMTYVCVFLLGGLYGEHRAMEDAFDRGHAVQCTGKMGYHWECPDD